VRRRLSESEAHAGHNRGSRRLSQAILELSGPEELRVTSNALAGHLDIRPASVTGMLQKLAAQRPSFIKYQKHHGVVSE